MKKMILALAALAFMAWGCSSDDDDDNTPTPPEPDTPAILTPGTDGRPTWPAINFDLYEQNMYVEIQLQDIFLDHASDADLLSAKIGDEIRGVAKPLAIDGTWVFPLFIAANESGGSITLSYYCERLHRIFNKTDWTHFDANTVPTGDDELHRPIFVK